MAFKNKNRCFGKPCYEKKQNVIKQNINSFLPLTLLKGLYDKIPVI